MAYVQKEKRELRDLLEQDGRSLIQQESDLRRKRITGILLRQQSEALDLLDCVDASAQVEFPAPPRNAPGKKGIKALTHPVAALVLSLGALLCAVFAHLHPLMGILGTVWIVLLLAQSLLRLVRERPAPEAEPPRVYAEATVDSDRARAYVRRVIDALRTGSEDLEAALESSPAEERQDLERELARIFACLYEARLDHPSEPELDEALSRFRLLLRQLGLQTLSYSPETRQYFTVERAEYPSQERSPAVTRIRTGELLQPGTYIEDSRNA